MVVNFLYVEGFPRNEAAREGSLRCKTLELARFLYLLRLSLKNISVEIIPFLHIVILNLNQSIVIGKLGIPLKFLLLTHILISLIEDVFRGLHGRLVRAEESKRVGVALHFFVIILLSFNNKVYFIGMR